MNFFSKGTPAVEPDEVVFRGEVHGTCNSHKCNGTERNALKTVYGDTSISLRCTACQSNEDFVEDTHDGRDPKWRGRFRDNEEDTPVASDTQSDRYYRRKGRT